MNRKNPRKGSTGRKKAASRQARYNAPIEWTEEMLGLLGKVPDRELSERYGIDISTICKKRQRRGIPPFRRSIRRTARNIKILGLPTEEAARRLGLSLNAVLALRKRWNLPPPSRTEWRWNKKTLARLGKEPDTWIAWDTGMGFRTVRAKREALGIPPCGLKRLWTTEEEALLGTAPDRVIAERIGRSVPAVQGRRWQLRVPAWSNRNSAKSENPRGRSAIGRR